MSILTYCLIGLWVLKVHIKRRDNNRLLAKSRLPFDIDDDDEENVFVFGLWPWVVFKWWFG